MLDNIGLFAGLSAQELDAVRRAAVTKAVGKNTVFIQRGEESSSLYIILRGKVKVFVAGPDGKEKILNIQGPGEYLGELALLADSCRTASVMTLEDSSFLVISKAAFLECLGRNPSVALNLIRDLVERIARLTDTVSDLALRDVYCRLAKVLQEQARQEKGQLVTGRLTQQEIAGLAGASREMIGVLLRDLKAGGYIDVKGKRITLLKKLPSHW